MFSKDNLKKLAEQAQKAGNRLATNAGGTTNTWFAGQISPEKGAVSLASLCSVCAIWLRLYPSSLYAGEGLEGLSDLPPEQAVVKLQRQNARLRRKAEAAMALEQENANLKSQLNDVSGQMVSLGSGVPFFKQARHYPAPWKSAMTNSVVTDCCLMVN